MLTRNVSNQQANPTLIVLEDIHVAAPCPAAWDQMTGDHRVRHCAECSLNVYNLSEMTRTEAEQLIRSHEGRLCVRFYRRADGTILTQNCPRGLQRLMRRVSRIAAAVLTATLSVGSAFSHAPSKTTQTAAQENQGNAGIDLTVMDPTGALIPGAQVQLCGCSDHVKINARTDAAGVAHFAGLKPGAYAAEIKAAGFKSKRQNIKVQAQKITSLPVKLKVAPASMTVEVTASPVEVQGAVMGMTVTTQSSFPFPTTGVGGRPSPLQ